jgi:hypothetical protein
VRMMRADSRSKVQTMLPLALWLLTATPAPLDVDVYVPLCDSALIACGPNAAGDPESLDGNLYWGAKYGAERYLSRAPGFAVVRKTDKPFADQPWVLRSVELVRRGQHRGEGEIRVRLLGYSGKHIDQALADFLGAASGASPAAVVVWAGHDRLMDVAAPPVARGEGKPVVVLACTSERYFGPALKAVGARPLAWTRTFMAPEAYLLEALVTTLAEHGPAPAPLREALAQAYARYQRISPAAARSVFAAVPAP